MSPESAIITDISSDNSGEIEASSHHIPNHIVTLPKPEASDHEDPVAASSSLGPMPPPSLSAKAATDATVDAPFVASTAPVPIETTPSKSPSTRCSACGEQALLSTANCPACGEPLGIPVADKTPQLNASSNSPKSQKSEPSKSKSPAWYDQVAVAVLLLIFCFPIGLIAMWKGNHFTKKARIIITFFFGFLFLLHTLGTISKISNNQDSTPRPTHRTQTAPIVTPPPRPTPKPEPNSSRRELGITYKGYNAIQNGMSYSEVVAILGKEGTELSRVSVGDRKLETVMYSWQRRFSGANILVTFQGGQVEMKAQAGLD